MPSKRTSVSEKQSLICASPEILEQQIIDQVIEVLVRSIREFELVLARGEPCRAIRREYMTLDAFERALFHPHTLLGVLEPQAQNDGADPALDAHGTHPGSSSLQCAALRRS
ncbi:MAG: hypothetical protein M3N97_00655 [Pseudomonadota bacterium]|nr:hypothetical protein [Pseudomonadota bacterium]